jgi:hypothetical protein
MSAPPVAIIGLAAAVGLFAGAVAEPDAPPPGLGFAAWGEKCRTENLGLSPEAWTRRGDAERISAGRYVEPAPLNCVLAAYRPTALKRWADAGDPVALLAVSYAALTSTETPCQLLPQVRRDLERAYRARRSDFALDEPGAVTAPLARAPEAAVLLAQAQAACGQHDQAAQSLAEAQTLGFEVRAVRLEVKGAAD